jgi:hypothetical protein
MEWFGVAFPSMKESYIARVPSRIWLSFILQEESTMRKVHTPAFYVRKINASWRKPLQGIFETGDWLIEAKVQLKLKRSAFEAMIRNVLPFQERTAEMLMVVAADRRLRNPKHASLLPPSWYTLYLLTRIDDVAFDEAIASGTIHPDMQRSDAKALLPPPQSSITVVRQLSQPSDNQNGPLTVPILRSELSAPSTPTRFAAVTSTPALAPPAKMVTMEDVSLPVPKFIYHLKEIGELVAVYGHCDIDPLVEAIRNAPESDRRFIYKALEFAQQLQARCSPIRRRT